MLEGGEKDILTMDSKEVLKFAKDLKKFGTMQKKMIGAHLITKQTGPEGQKVQKVLVHAGVDFERELYFGIVMDRAHQGPVDIVEGIQPSQTKRIAEVLGFTGKSLIDAQEQMKNLYKLFIGTDATQVEINPLVVTKDGLVYCVDAKINFDDNASFRQKKIF